MILTILFSHILVGVMLFFCFLALLFAFKHKKESERDKKDFTRRHNEEMHNRLVEHDEFQMYDN